MTPFDRADIEQETAIRAWKKGGAGPRLRSMMRYYAARDLYRRAFSRARPEMERLSDAHTDTIPAPGLTPEELAICRQEIVAAVKPLRWKATAALVAAALGFSYAEIGRVIGIKPLSVQTLIWRARQKLKG